MKGFWAKGSLRRNTAAVAALGLLLCAAHDAPAEGGSYFSKVMELLGRKDLSVAEDFQLTEVTRGMPVRLNDYRGKRPVLLYFWAIWCPACQSVKKELAEFRRKTPEERLEILAINVGSGDSLDRLERYQKAHPVPFPVLYDDGSRVTESYGVQGIPLFVLVDRNGRIVYRDHTLPDNYVEYLD